MPEFDAASRWFPTRDGVSVNLSSLHIFQTYGGMFEGYPNARVNGSIIDRVAEKARQLWGDIPVTTVRPVVRSLLDDRGRPYPCLPDWAYLAMLDGTWTRDDDATMSHLVVTWFADTPARPMLDEVAAVMARVNWKKAARDWYF